MEPDENAIREFKKLYFKQYGKQLTNDQAIDYGKRLIRLVKAVYGKNLPLSGFDNEGKERNNGIELTKAAI